VAKAKGPLAGVRVLDLTRVLAGPFCAMMLGDMGAEVIKVEEPGKGDDTRSWPPFVGGESTYFMSVNRSKKSITLNLKAKEGQEIFRKLAKKCDVLLENFRPGTMDKLGFGYRTLARLNPRLVYCSVSGFGESGPEAHRAGYDLVIQAALDGAGLAWVSEDQVVEHLSSGALVRVLEDWCPPFPGFFLYYPSRRQQPAALAALVDTLRLENRRK